MKHIIGLDIGGTKIEGIVFDGKKIIKKLIVKTPNSLEGLKYSLFELVKFLSAERGIEGVGIGMAGVVDPKEGVWLTSPNLKFVKKLRLADLLHSYGFKQVKIDNDANCFARAEAVLGQGRGHQNLIGIILGTGIGSGLYINGRNFRGSHHSGGEIGQLMVGKDTLEHHYQKAKQNEDWSDLARLLAVRFSDLINIFDPDCLVLGGSVSQFSHKRFLPKTVALTKKYLLNKALKPKIFISRLSSSGALGAALLFTP